MQVCTKLVTMPLKLLCLQPSEPIASESAEQKLKLTIPSADFVVRQKPKPAFPGKGETISIHIS